VGWWWWRWRRRRCTGRGDGEGAGGVEESTAERKCETSRARDNWGGSALNARGLERDTKAIIQGIGPYKFPDSWHQGRINAWSSRALSGACASRWVLLRWGAGRGCRSGGGVREAAHAGGGGIVHSTARLGPCATTTSP
jgi:hypothetical protein